MSARLCVGVCLWTTEAINLGKCCNQEDDGKHADGTSQLNTLTTPQPVDDVLTGLVSLSHTHTNTYLYILSIADNIL